MKKDVIAISGLKVAGVIALLASLILLPAASAGCWAMTLGVQANPSVAEPGQEVVFTYTVTNTGDSPLYDITISGQGNPDSVDFLDCGQSAQVTGYIEMGESNVFNLASATAQDEGGRLVVRSYARCIVLAA